MRIFYSKFHECYVAQFSYEGTLYTGRGESHLEALIYCLRAMCQFAPDNFSL